MISEEWFNAKNNYDNVTMRKICKKSWCTMYHLKNRILNIIIRKYFLCRIMDPAELPDPDRSGPMRPLVRNYTFHRGRNNLPVNIIIPVINCYGGTLFETIFCLFVCRYVRTYVGMILSENDLSNEEYLLTPFY